jgi:hypothetical protein
VGDSLVGGIGGDADEDAGAKSSEADVEGRLDFGHFLLEFLDAIADIETLADVLEAIGRYRGQVVDLVFHFLFARRIDGRWVSCAGRNMSW